MVASVSANRQTGMEPHKAGALQSSDLDAISAASKLGRQLDQQAGVKVATTTFNGQVLIGADFLRGFGVGQWGYIAVDPIELGRAGVKLFKGEKLTDKDVVPLRMQIEGGFEGLEKLPGIGKALAQLMKEKYPNALQGDAGLYINLNISGRSDGKPGVVVQSFDLVAYADVPAPPGLVKIDGGKVTAGGLDKNFTHINGGIGYRAGKGFGWLAPTAANIAIMDLRKPPNATDTNGKIPFFDGWTVLGTTGPNDNGANAARSIAGNALSGNLPGNGNSAASKIASGATYVANAASLTKTMWEAMNGKKELINGAPKTEVGIGVMMGVFRPPGPRLTPAPVPLLRLVGTVAAELDGSKAIHFDYQGHRLLTTSLPQIKQATDQVMKALEQVPGAKQILDALKSKPAPKIGGDTVTQSVKKMPGYKPTHTEKVSITVGGKRYDNVPALPGASVSTAGQRPITVAELVDNINKGVYSGSRINTQRAFEMSAKLPAGRDRDYLQAKLMSDYLTGATKTVDGIIRSALKGDPLSANERNTIIDVNNLLAFTNQLRVKVGAPAWTIPNLAQWAQFAKTGR
jgi:hypothetical protein